MSLLPYDITVDGIYIGASPTPAVLETRIETHDGPDGDVALTSSVVVRGLPDPTPGVDYLAHPVVARLHPDRSDLVVTVERAPEQYHLGEVVSDRRVALHRPDAR